MTTQTHAIASPLSLSGAPRRDISPQQLREQLLALPFPDFARCLARLLGRLGYEETRLMGVTEGRGRNAYGGFDLQATSRHGLSRSLLLAQVKQYRRPVPRSFVDELRGAMLRLGAQQGILLTTATFSPAAREAAASAQHALPIRLVEGDELIRLLLELDIPVGNRAPHPVPKSPLPTTPSTRSATVLPPPPNTATAPPRKAPPAAEPGMTISVIVTVPDSMGEEKQTGAAR
jgi:hypothetical protein